jgi:hypothetical protein
MNKKKMIAGLIILSLVFSCREAMNKTAEQSEGTDSSGQACTAPSDRNPNGASELAVLMREMETQAEIWKGEIEKKEAVLSSVPASFYGLKTAAVTKPTMKNENFNAFADDFITFSEALVKGSADERKDAYNSMVNGCMNCHTQMCPGPMVRIKKFLLK